MWQDLLSGRWRQKIDFLLNPLPAILNPFAMIFLEFNDPPQWRIIMILSRLILKCNEIELPV